MGEAAQELREAEVSAADRDDDDRRCGARGQRASTREARRFAVEQVVTELRHDPSRAWTLGDMASIANLSPYHFNRVFRSLVGTPPRRFLAGVRMAIAKHLVLTTDLPVTRICFEVGYESVGTFTHRFTELVGASPSDVRRMCRDGSQPSTASPAVASSAAVATVTGSVSGPDNGVVYVGLFDGPQISGRPKACARLDGPGGFRLVTEAVGRFHVHAFSPDRHAECWPEVPPTTSATTVGHAADAVVIGPGRFARTDVRLRPLTPLDPPILACCTAIERTAIPMLRSA